LVEVTPTVYHPFFSGYNSLPVAIDDYLLL